LGCIDAVDPCVFVKFTFFVMLQIEND